MHYSHRWQQSRAFLALCRANQYLRMRGELGSLLSEEIKRTCCLIVDDMHKFVEDPAAVIHVTPKLEPLVTVYIFVQSVESPSWSHGDTSTLFQVVRGLHWCTATFNSTSSFPC